MMIFCVFCQLLFECIVEQNDYVLFICDVFLILLGYFFVILKWYVCFFFEVSVVECEVLMVLFDVVYVDFCVVYCFDGFNVGINDGVVVG